MVRSFRLALLMGIVRESRVLRRRIPEEGAMARTRIDQVVRDGVTTLQVTGPLTFGDDAGALYHVAILHFKAGRSRLVVDLRGLTHLDATGIGELVDIETAARWRGGGVTLAGMSDSVEVLLSRTNFLERFSIETERSPINMDRGC
jgi:anti-sigma B factor antagonist